MAKTILLTLWIQLNEDVNEEQANSMAECLSDFMMGVNKSQVVENGSVSYQIFESPKFDVSDGSHKQKLIYGIGGNYPFDLLPQFMPKDAE